MDNLDTSITKPKPVVSEMQRQAYERAQILLERSQPDDVRALINPFLSQDFRKANGASAPISTSRLMRHALPRIS